NGHFLRPPEVFFARRAIIRAGPRLPWGMRERSMATHQHDAERLTRWVREHQRPVWGFLLGMTRDRHLADDLLQETFCRAWQARSRYREVGQERAYLLRIADRLARDRLRSARRGGVTLALVDA